MHSPLARPKTFTATLLVLAATAAAVELKLEDVPKPILDAVTARFEGAKIEGAAKEQTPEGKTVYEVSLLNDKGKTIDVSLTSEATIFFYARQITRKDLPAPVLASLTQKYPKARYTLYEEATKVEEVKETLAYYEVDVETADKQVRAVFFGADGKVQKVEKKAAGAEDE